MATRPRNDRQDLQCLRDESLKLRQGRVERNLEKESGANNQRRIGEDSVDDEGRSLRRIRTCALSGGRRYFFQNSILGRYRATATSPRSVYVFDGEVNLASLDALRMNECRRRRLGWSRLHDGVSIETCPELLLSVV